MYGLSAKKTGCWREVTIVERWPLVCYRTVLRIGVFFCPFNNCIAKVEVGCLEYPGASTIGSQLLDWNNAPLTGTTAQPSHEPPHKRKGTGPRHTEKHQWREKLTSLGGGGRGRKWLTEPSTKEKLKHASESHDWWRQLLGMRMPKTADLRHLRHSLTPLNCI